MCGQEIKNIHEMGQAAQIIGDMGPGYVLIKEADTSKKTLMIYCITEEQ